MKLFRLAPAVLILTVTVASGQEAWLIPFAAAFQPDIRGFNQSFAGHGLPMAATRHYGWGIEVRSLVDNILLGPMFFRTWDDASTDSFHLRTEASGMFAEAGLKLVPTSFLTITPIIGAGGLSQSFSIRARTGDLNFEELLGAPGQAATILSGMKLTGLAALEFGLATRTTSGRYGLAVRAGYLYSPLSVTWHLVNGARIVGTPAVKLAGPFFSLGLLLMPAAQNTSIRS
ncbi:MAG: hypothetical protein ABIL25_03105 [candidate division WOR-3 bacterium]